MDSKVCSDAYPCQESHRSHFNAIQIELVNFARLDDLQLQLVSLDKILKSLNVVKALNWHASNEDDKRQLCGILDTICKLYVNTVYVTKISKAILKIIRVLYLLYPSDLQSTFDKEVSLMWFKQHPIVSHKELQRDMAGLISFKLGIGITHVSAMLDECPMMKVFIKKNFPEFIFSLSKIMKYYICDDENAGFTISTCQIVTKVSLQVIQHFIDEIQPLIWQRSDSPLQLHISNIVQYLLYQIFNQKYSQECGLLSGCIVGLLINTVNNKEQCIRTAIGLLDNCKAVQEHSCIDVNFGKFAFPLDVNTDNYFPTVVLIKAMLSCLDKEILVHPIYNATQEKKITLLYDILFCEVCKCCKAITEVHYHAFQVLTLWLQCVRDTLYLVCRDFKKRMFYEESEYTKIVLQLVFENWENPIVGVAEHIKTSFTLLLEIYEEENKLHLVNDSQFFEELCMKLSTTSWHMKGKYAPLCALIPYIGAIKFLTDHPDVTGNLVSCLATNYLASSACEVYKTFLYNLRKECCESTEDGLASCWSQYWMKSIIEALCHKTQLLRHNASHYWLPWTLKIFPCTYSLIIDELGSHKTDIQPSRCLHTQISVLSAARTLNIMNVTQMDVELIKEALFHLEDDIRSDAVGLLCTVQRKSELVSELELGLLKEFLPFNMNSDSSSFRQHLYAYIKRLLVRIRDSCIAMLKQHDKVIKAKRKSDSICVLPNEFKASIDFVDFLFKLCITSLFPGSCYQRKKTLLDLLLATFETMATEESASTKHGQTTDSIKMLLAWANDNNKWNFFSSEHGNIILHCIEDGTNEIRELSYKILTSYYPWQLTISATQIIHHAYELVSSPKAMQCESGALMWKMIFEKFVCNLGWCFSIVPTSPGILEVAMVTNTDEIKCCKVLFMTQLVDLLKHQYDTSQSNLLKSATITPMHGIVLAIRRCLTETSYVISNIDEWKNVIHQIITVTETIINFMLQILFGKKSNPDTDTSPDFAEMGMAIDEAIVESKDGGNDHEESAVISVEHQLILAYSWLNIKECSLLLGAIAEKLPLCDEFSGVLSTEQIQKMADMFVKVLTKCRHRGAIEGCNLGFMKLCSRLLSSSSQELSSIPKTLLDQVFCLLDSSLSGTSITRRSAGLPLMVETITACEPKGRERSLLKLSMTRLLQTVNHPIPTDTTQTIDLPQVHALNIMKSLFRNSVLGNTMLQYASDVVMVTIEGFSSSSWAIRNSATLLYGTLVARMLGQKRVQDEHSDLNTITAQEFFYRYPKLQSYLLSEVIKASTSNNRLNLHPGLHPVLTLLSKLAVGIQQYSSECALSSFIQPVMELSSSPIYAVRVLSASALVPLVTMEEQPNILSAILDDLPASFDAVKYHNKLHGMLLQIEKLLQSLTSHERFMSSYSSVIGKLQAKLWLAKSDNPCPLTRALYVNILLKCLTNMEDESEKYQQLKLHVFKIVTDFRNENVENLVCGSILSKAMVEASWVFQQEENISQFLHQCLLSSDTEIQLSSLHHINHVINSQPIITGSGSDTLLTLIIKDLKHESSQSCLLVKLQIFILLMQHDNLSISDDFHHLWQILLPLARGVKGSTMAATAVPALAVILKRNLDCEKSRHYISDWCSLIQEYSSATNVEDLRLAVTKSLQIVGCDVLQAIANSQDEQLVQYAINIFQCSMCLLQDEVYEIRMEGAQFTSLLPRTASCIQYSSLHSNVGLQLLFVYMFHTYQWSCVFVMYILDYMQGKVSVVDVIEKHIKASSIHLFEQEDANIYAEHLIMTKMMYNHTKDVINKGRVMECLEDSLVISRLSSCCEMLTKTEDLLPKQSEIGHGFYGILGSNKPFLAVYRLLLYTNLLIHLADNLGIASEDFSEQLQMTIYIFNKISSLNPLLPNLYMERS